MRFLWHPGQPAPIETRLRDLHADKRATTDGDSEHRPELSCELSNEELAGLALQRVSALRELPAARLEAIGRRGFARSTPRPSMVALRWSLATLGTVLALNLAVAAALAGIDRFGPRISQLLAGDHARLTAETGPASHSTKALPTEDGLAKVGHLLWVDRDPQQALAAFVAYVQHNPKASLSSDSAVLAKEAGVGNWDVELSHAEGMRDASRCPEALNVFEKVLAAGPESTDLRERAVYGRAQCLIQTGDAAGAKAELHRYLTSFPKGKFAPEARKALAE
jgi:Tetratricopeptide repeat